MFQKYSASQLKRFVGAMDEVLTEKLELLFIGGSAAALAYNLKTHTKDIDIRRLEISCGLYTFEDIGGKRRKKSGVSCSNRDRRRR